MVPNQTAVRCVALLLLLFAAVDLFGVDLFFPTLCASPSSEASRTASPDDDDCFCCCGHIVFNRAPQLKVVPSQTFNTPTLTIRFVSAERTSIYRPPRS